MSPSPQKIQVVDEGEDFSEGSEIELTAEFVYELLIVARGLSAIPAAPGPPAKL